jgi:N-acetyl sugar amidotransferase
MKKVFWCKNCVVMSSRPRITFDKRGFCSACQWAEKKKKLNWKEREESLINLLKKHKSKNNIYDCVVAVSGGKDGSYVSYNLKHKYNVNPLTVTIRPATETETGIKNLNKFIKSGYQNILVSPDDEAMRRLNKLGLTEMGFPYYGWLISVHTAVLRIAVQFNVSLVFYSEDGEVEYGGDAKNIDNGVYDVDYMKSVYLEQGHDKILKLSNLTENQLYWFKFPSKEELKKNNFSITHYSFYESWDPYRNYQIAKKFCGLSENENLNDGTYTNFAQNDQKLYALHVYFMYLKFGFGRTTQDAAIDVRRGSLSRDQAVQLIKMYDDKYPEILFEDYCDYYKMSMPEFLKNIDKWVNKDLFEKKNKWVPKFTVE